MDETVIPTMKIHNFPPITAVIRLCKDILLREFLSPRKKRVIAVAVTLSDKS